MVLWVLRGLFILLMAAASLAVTKGVGGMSQYSYLSMLGATAFAAVLVGMDVLLTRKSLAALSGAFLGLVVGMVFAYGLGLIVDLMIAVFWGITTGEQGVRGDRGRGRRGEAHARHCLLLS